MRHIRVYQQVWVLEGAIDIAVGDACHRLREGDCLAMQLTVRRCFTIPHANPRLRCGDRLRTPREETMMSPAWTLRRLHGLDSEQIEGLADVLIDCVEGGASVSFMLPLSRKRALGVLASGGARRSRRRTGAPRRRRCARYLRHIAIDSRSAREPTHARIWRRCWCLTGRGGKAGAALMRAAKSLARECGKTLLVLDAVTGGDAARLTSAGMGLRVGDIPGYALMPRGEICSTTVFYRNLEIQQEPQFGCPNT